MREAPASDVLSLLRSIGREDPAPVYLLVGEEALLKARAVRAIRARVLDGAPEGFNEDAFEGRGAKTGAIVAAVRTLPMMAARRFVLVRDVDAMEAKELTELASYLEAPVETACVVLVAEKLDGRSKLAKAAKERRVLHEARPLKGAALVRFVEAEAKSKKKALDANVAAALVDALGEDLAALTDAVERLSLFVGERASISLEDVAECVTRARVETIWKLVDAISMKAPRDAVSALSSLLGDRSNALGLLSMIARQLRMIAKMRQSLGEGASAEAAAKAAGIPPFKAQAAKAAARTWTLSSLERAFRAIATAERKMKGSRVDQGDLLLELTLTLTRTAARRAA